jgi:hypothetical protein
VAVSLRGDDYEFDGWGLRLQYNEQERRIDYLRVAYGKRLLLKNTSLLAKPKVSQPPAEAASFLWPSLLSPSRTVFLALSGAVQTRGGGRSPARRDVPATRPAGAGDEPVYRATFTQDVKVLMDNARLATSQELVVDFLSDTGTIDVLKGPQPTTAPAGQRSASPSSRASASTPREATTRPPASSADKSSKKSVEIQWTGPLLVVPLPGDRPARIAPGEAIVRLTGTTQTPVEVFRTAKNGTATNLRCATLTHWTIDQSAQLDEGPDTLVELSDSRGTQLRTHTFVYSPADGSAVAYGASTGRFPAEAPGRTADAAGKVEMMDVAWNDRCALRLVGDDPESMQVERATLQGGVQVKHPQIDLQAATLDLAFEQLEGSATPALKQLDADGKVQCLVRREQSDGEQKLNCDTLRMGTAKGTDGKLYPRTLLAIGNVHSVDPRREFQCGYLNVVLPQPAAEPTTRAASRSATRPSSSLLAQDIESLLAHDDVRVHSADGIDLASDQLSVENRDGRPLLTLHGKPATIARGADKLSGPVITMESESQHLVVTGDGKLTGVQKSADDQPEQPVEVSWSRGLDGLGDVLLVEGSVQAKSVDAEGALNVASADRVRLTTTRPATRPTTKPAVAQTKPAKSDRVADDLDVLSGRLIQSIILEGNAILRSDLNDPQGNTLRQFYLTTNTMQMTPIPEGQRKLVIPGRGQLLFQDNRPPADDPDARERISDPLDLKGITAFAWDDRLEYDEQTGLMTMTGREARVQVVRRPAKGDKPLPPLAVFGDKIIAETIPDSSSDKKSAPLDFGGLKAHIQLKKVTVVGNAEDVEVASDQIHVFAHEIIYDPSAHLLTLRGQPGRKGRHLDPKTGLDDFRFDELVLNTLDNRQVRSVGIELMGRK